MYSNRIISVSSEQFGSFNNRVNPEVEGKNTANVSIAPPS